jgi:transglutaminase-like putative cysteine protease
MSQVTERMRPATARPITPRGPVGGPAENGRAGPPERRGHGRLQLATEMALAGVTVAAVLGMHRLFADGSFRAPVLLQVVVAHVAMAAIRRWHLPFRAAVPLSIGLAALSIAWAQYPETTWLLLPSPDTLSAVQADLDAAWGLFQQVQAPAPVEPGFVFALSVAVWLIAFVDDWGAFRIGVSFEALLLPAMLYLFSAVLGADGGRVPSAALFTATAMVFLLLHRTWRQEETAAWVASRHQQARRALVYSGAVLVAMAVPAAATIGPRLPGANDDGLLSLLDGSDEDETRVVISPLVDIQSRLVEQSNLEVFTVRTNETEPRPPGAYWRLTALDNFDGQIWRSSYETDDADGELPRSVESTSATTRTVTQTIEVQALAQIWLPAAYEPAAIDTGDTDVDYDPASSTLIVDRNAENSDGLQYTVTSEIPRWTEEQLRTASLDDVPNAIAERYLELPDDFSEQTTSLAQDLTQDAATAYDKARVMHDYLREFEYSLEVQPGHDDQDLEQFLFQNRRGYCEQFAGAFAAMARSIGIPSRVVVGFTKGIQDPNEPTLYRVKGQHAHAWVELYFHGYGWVMFDPTPTRGAPGAEEWLGIPEGQEGSDSAGTTNTTVAGDQSAASSPTPGDAQRPDAGDRGAIEVGGAPEAETERSGEDKDRLPVLPDSAEAVAWPVLALAVAYVLLVPTALVVRQTIRRRRARSPTQRVALGWQDVGEQVTVAGLRLSSSLTVAERAGRMRAALPEVESDIALLARTLEEVTYGERELTPEEVEGVEQAAARATAAAARRQPWYRRVLRYLDIRRLFPTPDRARRSAHLAVPAADTGR